MLEVTVRRTSRAPVMVVALGLTLGLAMSGSSSAAQVSQGTSSNQANAAAMTVTPKALVRHIALVNSDFTDGRTVQRLAHGNRVKGQPTLGDCAFNYTTEMRRVERHQTLIIPTTRRRFVDSNEVVAYESAHFAGKAMRQLRKAIAQCPKHVYLPNVIAGRADERYDVAKIRTSQQLSVKDNAVVLLKVKVKDQSRSRWIVAIYQRHGTVLDAMYGESFKKPSPTKVAALRSLARITGARLAAS
jgi:hypothetical protein